MGESPLGTLAGKFAKEKEGKTPDKVKSFWLYGGRKKADQEAEAPAEDLDVDTTIEEREEETNTSPPPATPTSTSTPTPSVEQASKRTRLLGFFRKAQPTPNKVAMASVVTKVIEEKDNAVEEPEVEPVNGVDKDHPSLASESEQHDNDEKKDAIPVENGGKEEAEEAPNVSDPPKVEPPKKRFGLWG